MTLTMNERLTLAAAAAPVVVAVVVAEVVLMMLMMMMSGGGEGERADDKEKPLHTWTPKNMKSKHFV